MKRVLGAAVMFVASVSCTSQAIRGIGSPAAEAAVLASSRSVFEAGQAQDRQVTEKLLRKILAPEYRYMSSVGSHPDRNKEEEVRLQLGVPVVSFAIEHPRFTWLGPDAVLLQYVAHQRLRSEGKEICPFSGAVEAWSMRSSKWQLVMRTEWLIGGRETLTCKDDQANPAK